MPTFRDEVVCGVFIQCHRLQDNGIGGSAAGHVLQLQVKCKGAYRQLDDHLAPVKGRRISALIAF